MPKETFASACCFCHDNGISDYKTSQLQDSEILLGMGISHGEEKKKSEPAVQILYKPPTKYSSLNLYVYGFLQISFLQVGTK